MTTEADWSEVEKWCNVCGQNYYGIKVLGDDCSACQSAKKAIGRCGADARDVMRWVQGVAKTAASQALSDALARVGRGSP